MPHGDGSAHWLARQGHAELGRAVANHPVSRLADAARFRRWAAFATREERIVAYADKRAGQRLESMSARFDDWERRFPGDAGGWTSAARATIRARADRLEADVCRAAGVRSGDVGRLRWTGEALRAAAVGR